MIAEIQTHDGTQWVKGVPAATVADWMMFKFLVGYGMNGLILFLFPMEPEQARTLRGLVARKLLAREDLCAGAGIAVRGKHAVWDATSLPAALQRPQPPMDDVILGEVIKELRAQQLI